MSTPHLSDEAICAHLDHESGDSTAWAGMGAGMARLATAHLATCARCRARLSALQEAAEWVGRAPAPPAPSARARAVSRALAALDTPGPAGGRAPGPAGGREGALAPLLPGRKPPRRQRASWLAGAAALLAAGGLAAGVTLGVAPGGRTVPAAPTAAAKASSGPPVEARRVVPARHRGRARSAPAAKGAAATSRSGPSRHHVPVAARTAGARDLGDLGAVSGGGALTARLTAVLGHRTLAPGAKAAPSGLEPASPPPPSAVPACSPTVLPGHPRGWSLAYWARATYARAPAEVLVYSPAEGRVGRLLRVEVVSSRHCRLLLATDLHR